MAKEGKGGSRRRQRQSRGVFERPKDSRVWWVRYHDQHGREHREQVGYKGLAADVYRKRKTEIAERRFFPERIGTTGSAPPRGHRRLPGAGSKQTAELRGPGAMRPPVEGSPREAPASADRDGRRATLCRAPPDGGPAGKREPRGAHGTPRSAAPRLLCYKGFPTSDSLGDNSSGRDRPGGLSEGDQDDDRNDRPPR